MPIATSKADDDCLQELRWIYDRRNSQEAQRDLAAWIAKWAGKYPKLVDWVEANIGETLTFYRLPRQHHKHMRSTNMLERLNEEIKRRTRVVRIFPNAESCLRLVRALCTETHEAWLEDNRYLNMSLFDEQKKELLKMAAWAAKRTTSAMTIFLHNLTDTTIMKPVIKIHLSASVP